MADTTIRISKAGNGFKLSPHTAHFDAGDTIAFVSPAGMQDLEVCFSDAAAAAIEPAPDAEIGLKGGQHLKFTVARASSGGACATVVQSGRGGTPENDHVPAGVLQVTTIRRRPSPGEDTPPSLTPPTDDPPPAN